MVRNRNVSLVTIGVGLDAIRITIIDNRRILIPSTIGVMGRQEGRVESRELMVGCGWGLGGGSGYGQGGDTMGG
jgi:hypothetical protein